MQEDGNYWIGIEDSLIVLSGEFNEKQATIPGRVLNLISLIFGAVLFGILVGKISSWFVVKELRRKRMGKYKDHFIICNWNRKGKEIVKELQKGNNERDILIVADNWHKEFELTEEDLVGINENKIHYPTKNEKDIYPSPTNSLILEKIQVVKCKSVILLADDATDKPDEKNALIALAIKPFERSKQLKENIDIHIISELINSEFEKHLKSAGVDEIIYAGEYSTGIIAQSAQNKNVSGIYHDLLTYSTVSNEIYYTENKNKKYTGTFEDVRNLVNQIDNVNLILLGIRKSSSQKVNEWENIINPKLDILVEKNDELIILAYDKSDLKELY